MEEDTFAFAANDLRDAKIKLVQDIEHTINEFSRKTGLIVHEISKVRPGPMADSHYWNGEKIIIRIVFE